MYGGTILTGTQYTYIRVFLLLTVFFVTGTQYTYIRVFLLLTVFFVKFCGYF